MIGIKIDSKCFAWDIILIVAWVITLFVQCDVVLAGTVGVIFVMTLPFSLKENKKWRNERIQISYSTSKYKNRRTNMVKQIHMTFKVRCGRNNLQLGE